jgi:serine/threonine-protein kinase HipA
MNRCPITYEPCGSARYSPKAYRLLSRNLTALDDFPYTQEEQRKEALLRAAKLSIQGLQPKLSAVFSSARRRFEIVDRNGRYILKPQHQLYTQLPENEDLTMRLAALAGIRTPFHGMIYAIDGTLTYFVRRFDRAGRTGKIPVEDFAQLSGKTRATKYDSSMEQVAGIVERFCTFPLIEKVELFRRMLFNFLVGNEDMHLKNFSLIRNGLRVELAPAYDLVNTTIVLGEAEEESALPLNGKRRNLTRNDLVNYYGQERLGLNRQTVNDVLQGFAEVIPRWVEWIQVSFLSAAMKTAYSRLLKERRERLRL